MSEIKTVNLENLTPNMVILAYTRFSGEYKNMDEATQSYLNDPFLAWE